ncbi:M56 family metallopeptidase [Pelagicoccus sp. SDUM812002]|uniref:M56 family metallopeptidase n=1 Tax=Pelagicoccus sp. SDUM812002 TaxID=3041266 RepID=UPI00280CDBE0|nr:M56 family metallopeptidase [Pelagicoccus sp. SDUM812002]MDQ8185753.1 M56 family metallopeptidase [Pelagicoccus sp. SDUM812002]
MRSSNLRIRKGAKLSELSYFVVSHLWESSLFGLVCVLLILALGHSWSFSRHFLAWASLLKLLIPFAALAPLFSFAKGILSSSEKIGAPGLGYLNLTAQTLKIDTWVELGGETAPADAVIPWEIVAACVWAIGVFVLGAVWLRQYFRVSKDLRLTGEPVNDDWQCLARKVWEKRIQNMPQVVICRDERLAAGVFGLFRPSVIVPASLDRAFSEAEREAFLRHEFQHVYKRDTLWLFVQKFIRNLFWMHPLVWWLDRQISAEREILRDEEVIRKTENVTSYLNCLMKVSKIKLPSSYATSVGIMGAPFQNRIKSISRLGKSRVGDVVSAVGSVLAVVALSLFLSASLSLSELRAETPEGGTAAENPVVEPSLSDTERVVVKGILEEMKETGDKERALQTVLAAITEDSSAAFEFIAGNFYAEKDELEKAIEYYQLAAGKYPNFLRAIRNGAIMQVMEGHYEDAKENFLRAKRLGADDTTSNGLLGLCYLNTEDAASAEHYYRLAIEQDPEVDDWQIGLAKVLYSQGQKEEGNAVVVALAERLVEAGELDRAESLLEDLPEPGMGDLDFKDRTQ